MCMGSNPTVCTRLYAHSNARSNCGGKIPLWLNGAKGNWDNRSHATLPLKPWRKLKVWKEDDWMKWIDHKCEDTAWLPIWKDDVANAFKNFPKETLGECSTHWSVIDVVSFEMLPSLTCCQNDSLLTLKYLVLGVIFWCCTNVREPLLFLKTIQNCGRFFWRW